jgi:glycosyltransferase involved in cell wall biosynthesis
MTSEATQETISLGMIVKDETKDLDRALKSVADNVDEIVIVMNHDAPDETEQVAKKYGAKIYRRKWTGNFDEARNYCMERCTKDWFFWLDSDDIVIGAENIKFVLSQATPSIGGFYCFYDYAQDKYGNNTVSQWRERIVRNDKTWEWKAAGNIHEVMVCQRDVEMFHVDPTTFRIKHMATPEHHLESNKRNLQRLLKAYQESKDNIDPRIVYNLAATYVGAGEDDLALKYFKEYITKTGWAEELYLARIYMATIYKNKELLDLAEQNLAIAITLHPEFPTAYYALGEINFDRKNYGRAAYFCRMALRCRNKYQQVVSDPRDYDVKPWMLLAEIYVERGRPADAAYYFQKIMEKFPENKEVARMYKECVVSEQERIRTVSASKIMKELPLEKKTPFYNLLPIEMQKHPSLIRQYREANPKKTSSGKEIAIVCGINPEPWGPPSIQKGIGGSEEAVIYMAKRLVVLGWDVTVFNSCDDMEGEYEGVKYRNFWHYFPEDRYDVFIGWRIPALFDMQINAGKKYLWMHDVPNLFEFTKERVDQMDGIFVLSKFHQGLFKNIPPEMKGRVYQVPENKFILSANGLNQTHLDQDIVRKRYKMVYSSCPTRGLEIILDAWPVIKKEVPKAELHVYYGWKNFDEQYRDNPEKRKWKQDMKQKMRNLDGVFEHGRIGHRELGAEFLSADVWPYPCTFPEISCISAMWAQCAGAVPVVVPYAAVDETVRWGMKVGDKDSDAKKLLPQFAAVLINTLKGVLEPMRSNMIFEAKKVFNWDLVSRDWDKLFKLNEGSTKKQKV